jgi:hypothetical protein
MCRTILFDWHKHFYYYYHHFDYVASPERDPELSGSVTASTRPRAECGLTKVYYGANQTLRWAAERNWSAAGILS